MRTLSQQELIAVSGGGNVLSNLIGPDALIRIGILSIKSGSFSLGLISPLINVVLNVTWRREWADAPPIPEVLENA